MEKLVTNSKVSRGFTLLELLAVISVITLLMGVLLPALGKVKRQAKSLKGMSNQRQIVLAVNSYAVDNDGRYPESTATMTESGNSTWHWQEPTMMTACYRRPSLEHRSMSEYLNGYIEDASIMFSPSAPKKNKYLQAAWDAGDDWDNPDTSYPTDPLCGTYCFYWNYIGFLGTNQSPFRGPRKSAGSRGESKLLVSDYFGFGHWRNKPEYGTVNAFGSSERFNGSSVTPGTEASSAFWSRPEPAGNLNLNALDLKLHAGYTDGHVGSYSPSEVFPMKVSFTPDGCVPYPSSYLTNPGIFYLPGSGL
ncbi:MAG: prepilin-type N-terminal cleavage/methylation domain-containing protein [Phycisphaerae bacterium]|nr:prepilin-type N-terminal cleavage/methylation domain-containing protein [Phycisphaerae bacterium]